MGKKRYYPAVNAKTGESKLYYGDWLTEVAAEIQGQSDLIYRGFDTKEEADSFINAGFIEKDNIDPEDNNAVNKEIEDRKVSLSESEAIIVTDGSYMQDTNSKIVGYSWIGIAKDEETENSGITNKTDIVNMKNVGGEILAVEQGIKWALDNKIKRLDIYFDYSGLVSWAYGYRTNTPISKEYHDFIMNARKNMKIVFHKVSAHTGVAYNEKADSLAKKAIENN